MVTVFLETPFSGMPGTPAGSRCWTSTSATRPLTASERGVAMPRGVVIARRRADRAPAGGRAVGEQSAGTLRRRGRTAGRRAAQRGRGLRQAPVRRLRPGPRGAHPSGPDRQAVAAGRPAHLAGRTRHPAAADEPETSTVPNCASRVVPADHRRGQGGGDGRRGRRPDPAGMHRREGVGEDLARAAASPRC